MLDQILIPLDGSESFSETFCYIKELTERASSECILLHVQSDEVAGETASETMDDARRHPQIRKLYDALTAEGKQVTAIVSTGDPVEEISKLAAQLLPTSLVLMSTHGRSGLENIRKGSITEQVVRRSPCPVFVLHSTRPDRSEPRCENLFRSMLVPLDGSSVSSSILPCVELFAAMFNTKVILFHDDLCHDDSQTTTQRRELIEEYGVQLANNGISVELDYTTGQQPVSKILDRAQNLDIDIVAMATHGAGGKRQPLEESVTANVMRHTKRPLIVWSSDPQCYV